jgi:hypothetical protein
MRFSLKPSALLFATQTLYVTVKLDKACPFIHLLLPLTMTGLDAFLGSHS